MNSAGSCSPLSSMLIAFCMASTLASGSLPSSASLISLALAGRSEYTSMEQLRSTWFAMPAGSPQAALRLPQSRLIATATMRTVPPQFKLTAADRCKLGVDAQASSTACDALDAVILLSDTLSSFDVNAPSWDQGLILPEQRCRSQMMPTACSLTPHAPPNTVLPPQSLPQLRHTTSMTVPCERILF
jgi:hypothetical protein